ncbi:MAG: hypothetical protein JXA42_00765 [Anaerolineales bacterium]|nr:hypothetical protein [Anaerolineales bacterium]
MKQAWWRRLFKSEGELQIANLGKPAPENQAPQLDKEMLRNLVMGIYSTRIDELTCDECFEQVGLFAELVLAGKNAAEALPLVQDHLNRCPECHKEFEILLDALKAMAG